jgi:hypothetical protein
LNLAANREFSSELAGSDPLSLEEEEKTEGVWMKGHAGWD